MVSDSELKVAVLGLGYIGLPTAATLATVAARQHPDWRGVSIEIVNGNGISGAAARLARAGRAAPRAGATGRPGVAARPR